MRSSLHEAVERVRADAFAGRRCWIATPNLNFAIAARSDAAFRHSVLRSDLSLVDGMPLVWMARRSALPVPERVAGSDLFEALQAHPGPAARRLPVRRAAGRARRAPPSASTRTAAACAASASTRRGYGSIEAMSGDGADRAHQPQRRAFRHRRARRAEGPGLDRPQRTRGCAPPVLCHLGAVMNFSAGTVSRAPPLGAAHRARMGLWRIKEEPALWKRYARDGLRASELVATRVAAGGAGGARRSARLPAQRRHRWRSSAPPPARSCARRWRAGRRRRAPCASRLPIASPTRAASASICRASLPSATSSPPPCSSPTAGSGRAAGSRVTGAGAAARADLRRLLCDELLSRRTAS